MRLKLIACKALFRELSYIAASSDNFIDITYIRQGYHDTPSELVKVLQNEIDKIESGDDVYSYNSRMNKREFDAILLGYGLCSNGVVSLTSKKYPLVIPKVHDCISLFLGSKEKYNEEFAKEPGTYWYNTSWIENAFVPSEENSIEAKALYAELYGEENADFLYEMETLANYNRCAYIKWPELDFPKYEKYTKDAADYFGWKYECINGDSGMLKDFLAGNWDDRFLVVEPGKKVAADYDGDNIIISEEV